MAEFKPADVEESTSGSLPKAQLQVCMPSSPSPFLRDGDMWGSCLGHTQVWSLVWREAQPPRYWCPDGLRAQNCPLGRKESPPESRASMK